MDRESHIKFKLKPFSVPSFVIPEMPLGKKQDGFKPIDGIPLRDLSEECLEIMCENFRKEVMKKAGYL